MHRFDIETRQKDAIGASWSRCERRYNLRRDANNPILRLQSTEVAPRFEALLERTGGRQGIFSQLAGIAAKAGHCMVITDNDGILVRLESGSAGSDWNGIALGSVWDERIAGTNGVSMALAEGREFTVRGRDHFYAQLQTFACTAAPLRDAHNSIIGVVNLSSIDRGNPSDALFSQQLLKAATSRLQHALFERAFQDEEIVSVAAPAQRDLIKGAELVAVAPDGTIRGATSEAHALSGVKAHGELIGRSLHEVFGTDIESLGRAPGRVMSVRRDHGPMLDLWTRAPLKKSRPFPGWRAEAAAPAPRRVVPPSLRHLARGSVVMARLCERASTCFAHGVPFILEGETGTGKSALSAALVQDIRQTVTLDCAGLEDRAEDRDHIAAIMQQLRVAHEIDAESQEATVLVLENVDELPRFAQTAVRSVLDQFEASGTAQETRPRIICTSRHSLAQAVAEGSFRDDLYYLLAGAVLELPALRTREKVGEVAGQLANTLSDREVEITAEAQQTLARHAWPGNLREMRSVLQQALLSGDGKRVTALDLSLVTARAAPNPAMPQARLSYSEKQMILDALEAARWNVSKAARTLGMGRATINRKMKALGISRPN